MGVFELAIALLLVGALLTLWANHIGVPYPAMLALGGVALALMPGMPQISLNPDLALALFVAPVLLDAAYDASPRDLRDNFAAVINLALFAVVLTIAAVAIAAKLIIPGMGWAPAIVLGAIVAPPDASAATAVLRPLRPPHRLLVILEGESLFNDASALLIYRVAVGAALTGIFSASGTLSTLLLTGLGGVVAGWLFARATLWLLVRVDDIPISVLLQFLTTFAVWLIAQRLGLSPIITVVSYAMSVARTAPSRIDGRHRIASYAVWSVAVFVLNALAFLLIGLQLRGILARLQHENWRISVIFAVSVCATVILARIIWWMPFNILMRWRATRFGARTSRATTVPTVGSGLVISWAGMRGIVTVAAALALPDASSGSAFPYRDLIILSAFCVVLSTLVVQGLTLGPLMRRLGLHDDGSVEREILLARVETARVALRVLDGEASHHSVQILRREYEAREHSSERAMADGSAAAEESKLSALQRRAVQAQRDALMALRARRVIGDYAFHAAEEEIDLLDLTADARIRPDSPT
jgi:CPA1 family monovalent cation:H+ antiporter